MPPASDDTGSLERARARLYTPGAATGSDRPAPASSAPETSSTPHAWRENPLADTPHPGKRHVRFAGLFFATAFVFFLVALGLATYFFYFGGNTVSADKVGVTIQGPTTIAGGDTVPLSLAIVNRNPTDITSVSLEIAFPEGTRSADDVRAPLPRYTEDLGTLPAGQSVTRSLKAVMFGGTGQHLSIPVTISFRTAGSNATFVKKASYELSVSSTPLSVSVDALSETVSGKPFTLSLTVRSNAPIPLDNVVLSAGLPFGFTTTDSSDPLTDSSFLLGTLAPGASKTLTLTGALAGQSNETRVFRFIVGTSGGPRDSTIVVPYMTQDASVAITAPFIATALTLNGAPLEGASIAPGSTESVTITYENTLPTNVMNAVVSVALSGSAIDYGSIRTSRGFYQSATKSILFASDRDPALASLAPGASGVGSFTFTTLPASQMGPSPQVTFTVSVSGTRVGQSNVPEQVSASATHTVKVATAVALTALSRHASGPITNPGPIPPKVDTATSYTIEWDAKAAGSAIAGGTVTAGLPSYVTYTGVTSGSGAFSYDTASRTVTWNTGDLPAGSTARGYFQVSLTPSSSQRGMAPALTGAASFSGHDRFAGVNVSATADAVTTETKTDPGYTPSAAAVQ